MSQLIQQQEIQSPRLQHWIEIGLSPEECLEICQEIEPSSISLSQWEIWSDLIEEIRILINSNQQ